MIEALVDRLNALTGMGMSGHGWAALTLGVVFLILVQGLLMGLAIRSNRSGHDAKVQEFRDRRWD
jgi:hypothetical protein